MMELSKIPKLLGPRNCTTKTLLVVNLNNINASVLKVIWVQRFLNISISNNSRIIDTLSSASKLFYDLNFIWGITAKAQLGPTFKISQDFNLTSPIYFETGRIFR